MFRTFCSVVIISTALANAQQDELRKDLEQVYGTWRQSIQTRNDMVWKQVTATHRQIAVTNRILSEKRRLPGAIFDLPAMPPALQGLKYLGSKRKGPTAKAYYFGKIDFGLGGNPSDNLLVLSFVGAAKSWRYDQAEYVNLAALPEVKTELAAGDTKYIDSTPELQPSGIVPPNPVQVKEAQYIAKVYAFCPGREVRVHVNQTSMHEFVNAQEAQLVIGGAKDGVNQIQYSVKDMEVNLNEPMTIRVYLMSQVVDVKPIKIYEYQIEAGKIPEAFGKGAFNIDANVRNRLLGR